MHPSDRRDAWIPSLDGLRAVSVALVIGSHLLYVYPELRRFSYLSWLFDGALGVRVFFVISGFLITTLLIREKEMYGSISLRRFYIRRSLRLLPVQLSYIFFLFFLTVVTSLEISSCRFATALTFTKNYACGGWIDGHLWSLAVEEQFYLVWPLAFASLTFKNLRLCAFILIAIAPLSRAVEYLLGSRLYAWLPSNADALMIGCLLAIYSRQYSILFYRLMSWHPTFIRAISVMLMYVPVFLTSRLMLAKFNVMLGATLQALCAATLIASVIYYRRGVSYSFLNLRLVAFIGTLSYSLYVWQMAFISKREIFGGDDEWFIRFPNSIILTFVAALSSYYILERPFASLRRRLHKDNKAIKDLPK